MSRIWHAETMEAAARVPVYTPAPTAPAFTAWTDRVAAPATATAAVDDAVVDPAAIAAEAFAQGFDEGRRTAELELAGERQALARLAESVAAMEPDCPRALGALLAETVGRLVRQIVGEAAVDAALLETRAGTCAALIADATAPARMRLHPDDFDRLGDAELPVALVPDPALAPGTVLLESGDGWIEDGPVTALDALGAALDRMGVAR